MASAIAYPDPSEFPPYFGRYIQQVEGTDIVQILGQQIAGTVPRLRAVSEEKSLARYEPGKWSIKEVLGHLIDAERIFAYRALRFARGDRNPLPSFEQDDYIKTAAFDACPWSELIEEFELVRRSNILMLRHLPDEAWSRRGIASGNEISVRGLAFVIAGHEVHHLRVLAERYGV